MLSDGREASTGVPFSDAINTSLQGGERTASAVPILLGSSVQNPPADFEQRTAREVFLGLRAVTSLKGGVNLNPEAGSPPRRRYYLNWTVRVSS